MNGMTETKTEAVADKTNDKKPEAKKPAKPKRRKPRSTAPDSQQGSRGAKRTAAAVLEVLAGARTPTEAAEVLGVSANRYYQLETRAIHGLLEACEPRPKGKVVSPEKQLANLSREADKLRNEAARFQALARASQRTVGIAPPKPTRSKKGGKRKRRRKPTVRALKVAKALLETTGPVAPPHEMPAAATPAAAMSS